MIDRGRWIMSFGSLLLMIAAILVFCGLLQRVLDRMYLTDRQALFLIGLMLIGTFLPGVRLGNVVVNIGGALIPLGVCAYLLMRTDTTAERCRAVVGSFITAALIYLLTKLLPSEAEQMWMEPLWLYGLCGGIVAWLIGRSRRASFICGVAGTLLADTASFCIATLQGYSAQLQLGGGGIADASIISGVIAVLLCETVGELLERLARRNRGETT